jgi:three-Cys-motif partner protein
MAAVPGKVMKIVPADANECIDDLVQQVEALGPETIGFAFVDPPGIQFDFETLQRLSKCARMDLLINFPLGMNIKRQLKHQLQKDREDDVDFDRYFGTSQWRDLCDESPSMRVIGQRLLRLYEDQLQSLGYAYVGDEHAVKNRGVSLYMLVFASKDPRGKEFWEKVTKIDPTGQRKLF